VITNIFALQDEIANAIVAKLRETVPTVEPGVPITTPVVTNFAAYDLVLRGRYQLNQREERPLRSSIRRFEEAIELDPTYGRPYVELAKAYALLPSYTTESRDEMFDRARAALADGIEFGNERDPTLGASMESVRALIAYASWDWIGAEIAFKRALDDQPVVDPDLLVWYSQFLSAVGRPAESLEAAQRAKELDPVSAVVNHRLSVALMWMDKDDEALRYARIAEEFGMGRKANADTYIVLTLRFKGYEDVRPLLIGVQTMFADGLSITSSASWDASGAIAPTRRELESPLSTCGAMTIQ
jgi:tetratricopeptide (TPR) repeat protein